jgi:hypothetical protein
LVSDASGGGRGGGGGSSRPAPTVKRGEVLTGKVVNVLGFGAFIMLPDGTQALLHVSEMRSPEGTVSPNSRDLVKLEDELEVRPPVFEISLHFDRLPGQFCRLLERPAGHYIEHCASPLLSSALTMSWSIRAKRNGVIEIDALEDNAFLEHQLLEIITDGAFLGKESDAP